MSAAATEKNVLVSGDVIVDHHLYKGSRPTPDAPQRLGTRVCRRKGGAWLLYRMLETIAKADSSTQGQPAADDAASAAAQPPPGSPVAFGLDTAAFGSLPSHLHGYAIWQPCPAADGSKQNVWRMTEPLGYGNPPAESGRLLSATAAANDQPAKIVVLDDAALGFRFADARASWPATLRNDAAESVEWIVLKMSSPLAQGDLWRTLVAREPLRDKLVTIVSINDVRRQEVRIVRGLSWERTAQDLVRELEGNPALSGLLECRHLIVAFWSEGALHVQRTADGGRRYRLLFDSGHLEGQWSRQIAGRSVGYMSALTVAVTRELMMAADAPDFERSIQGGLSAMRVLSLAGHGPVASDEPGLPLELFVEELRRPRFHFAAADVPPEGGHSPWTLIAAAQPQPRSGAEPLYGPAHGVALAGAKALANIPYARFGQLFTVDRDEIESLRTVERLVRDYIDNDPGEQPLCLAVFGQPGSGKSFSVKQIAKALLGKAPAILEFNLSQFRGPEELTGAFHQVRDAVLKGQTPFVFWDEFDSREYLWLQYLLAPMQDGQFHEDQMTHPIGKCIFIFAGGTSYDFAHFGPRSGDEAGLKKFRACKGPDFVSRLGGYLNVLGPNPRALYDEDAGDWVDDPSDICFPVRRALFLRVLLKHFGDERLEIDRGVLSVFLEVGRLKHGARSMEKLLKLATQQAGGTCIRRSDLPPAALMDLHVDSAEFLGIVNRNLPLQSHAEALAPAVHEFYLDLSRKEGWTMTYGMPFSELPDEMKQDNRAAAARIPLVLELAGLYVVPDPDHSGTAPEVTEVIRQNLEPLAEAEHNGWMEHRRDNGWQYAEKRDDAARRHPAMLPYDQLTEADKGKDRNQVRNYPSILAKAGYKIVTWSELKELQNGDGK